MDVVKNEQDRDRANFWLQAITAISLLAMDGSIIWQIAEDKLEADSFVVGAAFTLTGVLVNFCFPNSIGQAKQQDTINKLADKTPPYTGEAKESVNELGPQRAGVSPASTGGVGSGGEPAAVAAYADPTVPTGAPATGIPDQPPTVRMG